MVSFYGRRGAPTPIQLQWCKLALESSKNPKLHRLIKAFMKSGQNRTQENFDRRFEGLAEVLNETYIEVPSGRIRNIRRPWMRNHLSVFIDVWETAELWDQIGEYFTHE